VDEAAQDSQHIPPEASAVNPAEVEANAVQREPIVAAIPTVAPSQPLADAPTEEAVAPTNDAPAADEAPAEDTAAQVHAAEHVDAAPAPEMAVQMEADALPPETEHQPLSEPAIWDHLAPSEPEPEMSPAPFFVQVADAPSHSGGEPSISIAMPDHSPVGLAPAADLLLAEAPVPAAVSQAPSLVETQSDLSPSEVPVALVREEQIWSGPPATALDIASAEEISELHEPPHASEPHTSTLAVAEPQTDPPAPVVAIAAVEPRPVWFLPVVRAAPTAAIPSTGERAPIDVLHYLRLAGYVAGAAVLALAATVLVQVAAYRWIDPPTSMLMLGQRLTGTAIEQTWVPLEQISPNLVHAVILSEDGSFCRHHGVDWPALEQAIENDRGGSTITMQVVKNLFLWPARSYVRKALEIMLAYLVEAVWPKQRVLEIYLNIAEWGPGVFGAEAAAQHHFGKPAARLTAQEAALLAVSLPSPIERQAGYPGYQQRRLASNLLTRMRAVRTRPCVRTRRDNR
jgi:monofunctional glycosyltransferase